MTSVRRYDEMMTGEAEGIESAKPITTRDDAIINVVTGMISTIQFNPSMAHPDNCRNMAAMVIEQVRRWDSESVSESPT